MEKKEFFTKAELEIIKFEALDILTTSEVDWDGDGDTEFDGE